TEHRAANHDGALKEIQIAPVLHFSVQPGDELRAADVTDPAKILAVPPTITGLDDPRRHDPGVGWTGHVHRGERSFHRIGSLREGMEHDPCEGSVFIKSPLPTEPP